MPGGTAATPQLSLWGIPILRDIFWPAAQSGVALVGNFAAVEAYIGSEYRVDVSSEAGSRFDQNVTGFRAKMELGFNATPWYLTGHFQRVTGL